MPAASTVDNFGQTWHSRNGYIGHTNGYSIISARTVPSSGRSTPIGFRTNSPSSLPSSPIIQSPLSTSPPQTLRRNFSSTFTLIPEDRSIDDIVVNKGESNTKIASDTPDRKSYRILKIIFWLPLILITIVQRILFGIAYMLLQPFQIAIPTFWLSLFLWFCRKIIDIPISTVKWIFTIIFNRSGINGLTTNTSHPNDRRTIMISGGSTIQTLHMARNFYSSGARVIVLDFDDRFGLARFSTAVHRYYTVPKPTQLQSTVHDYISTLCDIVDKENVTFYVPICATSVAYYDALAKPHLELMGCTTFIPGAQEITILDDILEVIRKCRTHNVGQIPTHRVIYTREELLQLYDNGWINNGDQCGETIGARNILISCHRNGILERVKYELPMTRRNLKLTKDISEKKPWIVIRHVPGKHFITCTTVKDSKIVANVTCSVQPNSRSLLPEDSKEVNDWLNEFFDKVRFFRPINGHISFRFVKCSATGNLLPIGVRVGVSLPYICYTSVHSRVLCKPCPHFSRQNSGPIIQKGERYWIHEAVMQTLKYPTIGAVEKFIGTVLDKREALFVYWDPLPYCAYYHFQLPFQSIKMVLQRLMDARRLNHQHRPVQ